MALDNRNVAVRRLRLQATDVERRLWRALRASVQYSVVTATMADLAGSTTIPRFVAKDVSDD